MASEAEQYEPTYRQKNVDDTLSDHAKRIRRLEKLALVGIGYGLAEGVQIFQYFSGFL